MSYGLVLVFDGSVTEKDYWAVNDKLGIDRDGNGDWPEELVFHTGGPTETGGFAVIELWKSKAAQEAWMGSRLGPALGAMGVPEPIQIIETDTVNEKFRN